jgi:hypothetical protein
MKTVDMSEQAILRRLRTVDRLRDLCLALMKAKKVSDKKMIAVENGTQDQDQATTEPPQESNK